MVALLTFAVTLMLGVLLSELARRSVLSTAVLFLLSGFLFGGVFDVVSFRPTQPVVARLVEVVLFAVLFTDGMRVGVRDLVSAWRLPGRALLLGLPLTLVGTAVLAHVVAGLPRAESLLLGAVLSPTDPVLVSAIVGREEVPRRLRHLLNVESGLNDALALPLVLVLLSVVEAEAAHAWLLLAELGLAVVIGVAVPWTAVLLERTRFLAAAAGKYEPLFAFAVGLVVLGLGAVTHANLFLSAFVAGVTLATVAPATRDAFHSFGEPLTELLKLAALFVFGALISPAFLAEIGWTGYVFAVLALVSVRPLALGLSLLGSSIGRWERIAAAWFGPKGFASVVFALLVLKAGLTSSDRIFHLAAIVIVASILAHSSTDVLVARRFRREEEAVTSAAPEVTEAPRA